MPRRLAGRDAGTAGADPYCGVGDAPPNPPVAPARVRPSGGPREETEDPPDLGGKATRGALRMGPRGPRGDFPAEWTAPNRVSDDATREGPLGPARARGERVHVVLQVRFHPRTRGVGGEARGRRDRGGDVLQTTQGARGALSASLVSAVLSDAPERSPPRARGRLAPRLRPARTKSGGRPRCRGGTGAGPAPPR